MIKKRKHKIKKISSRDRNIYNISLGFGLIFIIVLALLYYEGIIIKLFHESKAYYFIEPSIKSTILFYILLAIYAGMILNFYNITFGAGISINSILKNKHSLIKNLVRFLLVIIFTIIVIVTNFTSYISLDNNGYHNDSKNIPYKDIEHVEISVERQLFSVPKNALFHKYNIECSVSFENFEYDFISSSFYDYESMYNFLKHIDNDLININSAGFNDLIEYERDGLLFNSDSEKNVYFIEQIMALGYINK